MATVSPLAARTRGASRDPERTQERILSAALREFSARGLAGARVDRIARLARVNKRMLYHYFGNKQDLFREILDRKLSERMAWAATAPDDPAENLVYWFHIACADPDWVRLMQWEALEVRNGPVIREAERRRASRHAVAVLRERQLRGLLARNLAAPHTLLSLLALTMFPVAFPQFTRLITGLKATDPSFRRHRVEFLRNLAESLRPEHRRVSALAHGGRG